jgi:hypothetical protein
MRFVESPDGNLLLFSRAFWLVSTTKFTRV